VAVEKVTVHPMEFARWCLAEGKKIGREARAAYAAAELAKRDRTANQGGM